MYDVTPGGFVGRLGLPSGAWIDFVSRFAFDDVIELIRWSAVAPRHASALRVDAGGNAFIVDAIAAAFVREVDTLAGRGLAKGYCPTRRLQPPYAGRFDVAYHLGRLAGRPDRLVTTTRQLSLDIVENQALAKAHDVLTRVPLRSDVQRGLWALAPLFHRVSRPYLSGDDVGRVTLTNLTRRYATALSLAEVILRSQSAAPVSSGLAGASMLFHMPMVWQSYVARRLDEVWRGSRVVAPYSFRLTTTSERAEADATVWRGDDLVALYDAKYKWPGAAPDRDDLYQMVTYCERLGVSEATLVYPVAIAAKSFQIGGKRIHMVGWPPHAADDIIPTLVSRRS